MSILKIFSSYKDFPFEKYCAEINASQVKSVLQQRKISIEDILTLLSDSAQDYLEEMAQRASTLTRRHFGSAISLFTPLYISNFCENRCVYCSFSKDQSIIRKQLSLEEIEKESQTISDSGIRHILVLTGESPNRTNFSYIKQSLEIINKYFSAVGIEMYPLKEENYKELITSGLIDSLTLYQETYNEKLYSKLHGCGPKSNYTNRLKTPDSACRQKIRALTIGALLGLDDFKREVFFTALHLDYLQKTYPEVELSVSFPRICPVVGDFTTPYPVSERQLVQIITAFRILFPNIGITMSTRESSNFRDGIMPLGITKVSAGVSTSVGGHTKNPSTTQFEIADHRSVSQMKIDLLKQGFQPVMHDWNHLMNLNQQTKSHVPV